MVGKGHLSTHNCVVGDRSWYCLFFSDLIVLHCRDRTVNRGDGIVTAHIEKGKIPISKREQYDFRHTPLRNQMKGMVSPVESALFIDSPSFCLSNNVIQMHC